MGYKYYKTVLKDYDLNIEIDAVFSGPKMKEGMLNPRFSAVTKEIEKRILDSIELEKESLLSLCDLAFSIADTSTKKVFPYQEVKLSEVVVYKETEVLERSA